MLLKNTLYTLDHKRGLNVMKKGLNVIKTGLNVIKRWILYAEKRLWGGYD